MSITTRKRTPAAAVEDTEAGWLQLVESGMSVADVARDAGVKPWRVYRGVFNARRREPTQGSVDSSREAPESTPAFGRKNPMAVPIYGARPFVRADLLPIKVAVDSPRRFVKPCSAEPPPREFLAPGWDGSIPAETKPPCPHNGPLPHGSSCYCEDCAAFGRPWDKRLVRDPKTDPKPEPKPAMIARATKVPAKSSGKMKRRKARKQAEMANSGAA